MEKGNSRCRVGVITGLQSEVRCLNLTPMTAWPSVRCAGASAERAAGAARELINSQCCEGLVSFGLAGGLVATVQPGDIVLADSIMGPDGTEIPTCDRWRAHVFDAAGDDISLISGLVFSTEHAITAAEDKAALAEATGAIAVDMESYAIASTARQFGVPFLVVRAVADPSVRTIPRWITSTIDERGQPKIASVLVGLMRHPSDVVSLALLAGDSAKGHKALRRFVFRIGPFFGFAGSG
ncbi:MAG: hypothetical protein H6905_04915 [Hyphomicrobiales bacterium]|nr:hypothetical protein [Hyphomicrobiales bacterium]